MEKAGGHLTNEGAGAQEGNYVLSSSPHSHTGCSGIAAKFSMGKEWEPMERLRQVPPSPWKAPLGWWFGCPVWQIIILAGSQ